MVNQFGGLSSSASAGVGQGVKQINVSLSGTTAKTISTNKTGVYHVEISSAASGAPTLSCDVTKRAAADVLTSKNVMAWPAADTCGLGVSWNPGADLQIAKSLVSYNGTYTVVLVGKT